ncbi:MAG: phytanoyl-CoA dioxygenase family protein [Salibaculum sp.]|uniref:phytanoyl-CoA dioxygenase family protein n=2 Tax=Roseobacteraceae TaxID=2854170 RepID=UPI0028706FF8|nr:phytanoyl-CoA dioxygenase family protein [Salibaculum sp.]MDR9427866.1 phytanoyl-CoA dioxygenase family protein [Salibaculum sp.]MDR9483394.1 phytanoyl-CoA dioxygenase family protein [Salibaculum sp.]
MRGSEMAEPTTPERDVTDVSQPWDQDNQAWWDWYVSLAANDGTEEEVLAAAPLPDVPIPTDDEVIAELAAPYPLTEGQVAFFRENGFIKLKNVFSPGTVLKLRAELIRLLKAEFAVDPDTGARDRFLSLEMVWPDNPLLRAYVLSPRLGQISADLLEVPAVRLYHDNVLAKQAGCGRTPWHFDDHHFPLDTHDVVTAWAPAQPIPLEMGPLAFAYPLDVHKLVDAVTFEKTGTGYDRGVAEVFARNGVTVDETPFEMGEVSFHHNLNFHTAARNRTDRSRVVLANTYYADGARIVDAPTMVSGDWQKFMPGVGPGDVAASPLNPVCWPVGDSE